MIHLGQLYVTLVTGTVCIRASLLQLLCLRAAHVLFKMHWKLLESTALH